MPLLKRKPFSLAELPHDLEPDELVYQIRYTKEIFRDYDEYLHRINMYRRRVWMCKVSGKTNLTYEEAVVSEKRATEKIQQLPKELKAPALRIIQYSMLPLRDLANTIAAKLQGHLFVGAELYGRKGDQVHPCKIVKVLEDGDGKFRYEVAWLDENKKVIENELVDVEELIQKKLPLNRSILMSFIRESTYRNAPWVLHDELARNHGISTDLPLELKSKAFFRNGLLVCNKKRKINEESLEPGKYKKRKVERENGSIAENVTQKGENQSDEEMIIYPIDDLLVQPDADDPALADRPSPSRDFNVPMDCIADLLMVWDFCSSFSRLLHLWPFSLEDFENAICHKDSNLILLMEAHSALLRLLLKANDEYLSAVQKRKRTLKITKITWRDYLCDFLEMINIPELCANIATIKRGHYGLLDAHVKLEILRELVNHALETDTLREKLDEFIEQRQELGATRREEALEEGRKRREEKERLKSQSTNNGVMNGHYSESEARATSKNDHSRQNGGALKNSNGKLTSSRMDSAASIKSENKHSGAVSKKTAKQNLDIEVTAENLKDSKDDKAEATEKCCKEQRKDYYERELEKRFIRTNPLGQDRFYNRYWWFRRDGRIFIESSDFKQWGYYNSLEELNALNSSLNCKGVRERALIKQLDKFYSRICSELQKRSKALANKIALDEAVLRRSTRVRASPREKPSFLRYINKWKED